MIEQTFKISIGNSRAIDKIIKDENIHYNHMILNKNEGLPEHISNSCVYVTVVKGVLSISLNNQESHHYSSGMVIKIPSNTKMRIENHHKGTLEIFILKAPAPQ
jgi:quercetin dioxygenase-like cupin family protein